MCALRPLACLFVAPRGRTGSYFMLTTAIFVYVNIAQRHLASFVSFFQFNLNSNYSRVLDSRTRYLNLDCWYSRTFVSQLEFWLKLNYSRNLDCKIVCELLNYCQLFRFQNFENLLCWDLDSESSCQHLIPFCIESLRLKQSYQNSSRAGFDRN